ncbi:Hypothetical protein FKW44_015389 [Caligus rogercresseyi]|uniref:Uncharacterized protein n=1 Tax=Caligus rogercresseyi TaxID=217165 RepID=A0A7T8H096_CALRO|nr:Hypothetical protein FKW44_015389 [Caligus rogercresseyi]
MVEYSRDNALHLNVEKTQILHLKNLQTIGTLGLLGSRSTEMGRSALTMPTC